MAMDPKQRRAATGRKPPITVERITDAALDVVTSQGYDALTMRSVAARLDTGPASLYAHVVNKADLDELIVARLCSRLRLPTPDAARWREQIVDVCSQLRDQYLEHPGSSRAALAMDVTDLDVLRVNEGMLAILLAGGIAPQPAAWAIDALFLYVGAYALEASLAARADREELIGRFTALPAERFPLIIRHAGELTAGVGHDRFDFTVRLIVGGLVPEA